jgi:hypothetical protein
MAMPRAISDVQRARLARMFSGSVWKTRMTVGRARDRASSASWPTMGLNAAVKASGSLWPRSTSRKHAKSGSLAASGTDG